MSWKWKRFNLSLRLFKTVWQLEQSVNLFDLTADINKYFSPLHLQIILLLYYQKSIYRSISDFTLVWGMGWVGGKKTARICAGTRVVSSMLETGKETDKPEPWESRSPTRDSTCRLLKLMKVGCGVFSSASGLDIYRKISSVLALGFRIM